MNSHTFDQYRLARCPQIVDDKYKVGNITLMPFLIFQTKGKVCIYGCTLFDNGNCAAYKFLMSGQPFSTINPVSTETVRDEAARLNLSISTIRKIRRGH